MFEVYTWIMPTGARKNSPGKYQNGNWDVKNLKFLVDFMDAMGMTTTDVANKIGLASRQSVYHWLVTDDVKFSSIIKLFDACGYDIIFSFIPTTRKKSSDTEVSIVLHEDHRDDSKYANRKLGFFQKAMDTNGVSSAALSEFLSIDKTTIFYWFKQDDCAISYLYKFAQYAKLKLKIEIKPKNK